MKSFLRQKKAFFQFSIIAFLCVCGVQQAKAQLVTVGNNTGISDYYPVYSYANYNYSQSIYLATEIIAGGATASPVYINSISYYYNTASTPANTWNQWTIYMANTSQSTFSASTSWVSGLSQVFSGTINVPSTAGQWLTINLSTPFLWDGVSNIVVGVHENSPGSTYPNAQWRNTVTGLSTDYRTLLYYGTVDPNPLSPIPADQYDNSYPDIQFNMFSTSPCTGAPPTGTVTVNTNSVCANTAISLDVIGVSPTAGYSYQWQSSLNGTTWTNIGAAQLSTAYTVSSQTITTYYQCVVTCTASALSSTATPVMVTQNPLTECTCIPSSLVCSSGDNFTNVAFSGINDNPTCSGAGYLDNTVAVGAASVTAGNSYSISTSIGVASIGASYIYGWIDYNQNGVFETAEYFNVGNGSSTTLTGTISVPFTALGGNTHMRLHLESTYSPATNPDPCVSSAYYGENIDYAINITPAPACSGSPVAGNAVSTVSATCMNSPINLDLSGINQVSSIAYQWQSSLNGTTWTNMGLQQTTTPYSIPSQSVTTYYRCVLTCTASAQSATSTPVTVVQNPLTACYCTPSTLGCSNASISNVVFQSINDSPVCSGAGYIDNTGTISPPSVSANQTYTTMVAISTPSPGLYNAIGAWLDFNANGVFDSAEYFLFGSGTSTAAVTGSITIPYTAVGGNTRMRVQLQADYSSITYQDPCTPSGAAGMTIDYLVNIIPSPACSGTPSAGNAVATTTAVCINSQIDFNLSGNGAVSGVDYQWQSSPNGTTWSDMGTAQNTVPYSVYSQSVTTYYRCVLTCTASAQTGTSTPVTVTQNPLTACYCIPGPGTNDCTSGNEIDSVGFASINNHSNCSANAYADYTGTVPSATISAGQSYTATIVVGSTSSNQVSLWIDYDQNGVFDPTEYTFIGPSNGTTDTVKNTVSIPVSALPGTTRMRVRNYRGTQLQSADACNNPAPPSLVLQQTYGETEDYLLTILAPDCSLINFPPTVSATASSATVCASGNVVFDIGMPIQPATGVTYQWQSSPTGSVYINEGTASASSSATISVTQSAYYQCSIMCHGTQAVMTQTVFVSAISPTITATASPSLICPGESSTLTATGGATYLWNTAATTSTIAVSPLVSTTYTVTGTDVNSCSTTAVVPVSVNMATDINGTVTVTAGSVTGNVILYQYKPFLVKFDSVAYTNIQANGAYHFGSVNSATYIVKAVPAASSLQITYAPNVISWQTAAPFTHSCVVNSITNIQVQPYATIAVGTGSLSGRIIEGTGYVHKPTNVTAPGNPIPGVVVKGGKNPGGAIFAQTNTDVNGNYSFANLPINTAGEDYFILVDIPGLDTNGTYHRQITASINSFDSLNFIVDNMYVNPVTNTTTSINDLNITDNQIKIFPNPANNYFTIEYSLLKQSTVKIELFDVIGKSVKYIQAPVSQAQGHYSQSVPVDLLGQGMYFVKLTINGSDAVVKLFVTN